MTDAKMGVVGLNYLAEQSITQFVIPAGVGATFASANNINTITFNAVHGLTFNPAAGTPPNFFITFGGSTSAPTGTGILVGNIFRILSIPSTSAITIYSTLSALTVTSLTGIPVFMPPFIASPGSVFGPGNQLQQPAGTFFPGPLGPYGAFVNCLLGANCAVTYNPDNTAIILDGYTTPQLAGATTPTTAPVYRNLIPASSSGQIWMYAPDTIVQANGTTATSRFSVIE